MYKEVINDISHIVDYLDKVIYILKNDTDELAREQDIATQKLEEAVFWLTYGTDKEIEDDEYYKKCQELDY